jgi:hypothetical protein
MYAMPFVRIYAHSLHYTACRICEGRWLNACAPATPAARHVCSQEFVAAHGCAHSLAALAPLAANLPPQHTASRVHRDVTLLASTRHTTPARTCPRDASPRHPNTTQTRLRRRHRPACNAAVAVTAAASLQHACTPALSRGCSCAAAALRLEALAVHDRGAGLVVLGCREDEPHRATRVRARPRASTTASKPRCRTRTLSCLARWRYEHAIAALTLGDPHLLEGGQRGQDRATDPHRVLALGRRHHLDLHGRGRERGDLLGHAVRDAWGHVARHNTAERSPVSATVPSACACARPNCTRAGSAGPCKPGHAH